MTARKRVNAMPFLGALGIVTLFTLIYAVGFLTATSSERSQSCHDRGGILVQTTETGFFSSTACVDESVVIP